jgi:hypothetical protein
MKKCPIYSSLEFINRVNAKDQQVVEKRKSSPTMLKNINILKHKDLIFRDFSVFRG